MFRILFNVTTFGTVESRARMRLPIGLLNYIVSRTVSQISRRVLVKLSLSARGASVQHTLLG